MLGRPGLIGCTSCMNWLRRPRLKRAVQRVAVLTVASRSRVAWERAIGDSVSGAGSEDVGLGHGRAEAGLEEVEVAARIGLADVAGEHPAVAALVAWFRGDAGGAPAGQLVIVHQHVDAARGH